MFGRLRRHLSVGALSLFPIALAACASSGQAVLQSASSNAASHAQQAPPCTTPPVQAVQVTANALSMNVGGTASFVACAQFAGDFSLVVSPSGIVSVPSSVAPTVDQDNGIKLATITITGVAPGTATITVTDKKGNTATVTVTVIAPYDAYLPQGTSGIYVVSETGALVKTLPIESYAVALDDAGDLYSLFNPTRYSATLQRYAPGATTPNATYQLSAPPGLTFDYVDASNGGQVAAFALNSNAPGGVELYADVWNQGTAGGLPSYTLSGAPPVGDFAMDRGGTIYLPQYVNGALSYAVYPPGSATPSRTIPETIVPPSEQANFFPNYMTVGPDGTLYVTEYAFTQPATLAGLYIYSPNGSEKFVATTSDVNGPGPQGVDIDATGNIYVANNNAGFVLSSCTPSGCPLQTDSLHDIEVFAPGGTSVLRHITGSIDPYALVVAPDGTVFASSESCCGEAAVNGTFLVALGSATPAQVAPQSVGSIVLYNGLQSVSAFSTQRRTSSYSPGAAAAHAGGASFLRYLRAIHRIAGHSR